MTVCLDGGHHASTNRWIAAFQAEAIGAYISGDSMKQLCCECGFCCLHEDVEVTPSELAELQKANPIRSAYLKMVDLWDGHVLLKSPCVYHDIEGCLVYEVRPAMCRGFWCGREDPYNEPIDPNRIGNPEYEEARKDFVRDGLEWGRQHQWQIRDDSSNRAESAQGDKS